MTCLLVVPLTLLIIGLVLWARTKHDAPKHVSPLKLLGCERGYANGDVVLKVQQGSQPPFKVRGRCTVWHHFPNGWRCSTSLEHELCDLWTVLQWNDEPKPGSRQP